MSMQKAITANPYLNNGGRVVKAGNVASTGPVKSQSIMDTLNTENTYGSKVILAVSATESGHLGTFNAKTNFARGPVAGEYIAHGKGYTRKINGVSSNVLASGGSDAGNRRPIALTESTRRINITSWDYVTGAATKGGSAGALVSYSQDHAARPSNAIPGELTYKTGKLAPVNDDYKPRTNP